MSIVYFVSVFFDLMKINETTLKIALDFRVPEKNNDRHCYLRKIA